VTARERAEEIARKIGSTAIWETDIEIVEQAITAAIEQDRASRECCKVEREAFEKLKNLALWENHETADEFLFCMQDGARRIIAETEAERIRARNEEKEVKK
jgi:hypothetical protein